MVARALVGLAGAVAGLLSLGGCSGEFAVDVTVARGDVPFPAGLSLIVASVLPSPPEVVAGLVARSAELSESAEETFRAIVVPHPDAERVRITARAFDSKANVFAEGVVELEATAGVVEVVIPLALVAICGDGFREAAEECDGDDFGEVYPRSCEDLQYAGGTLACTSGCTLDASACVSGGNVCGDQVAAGTEQCDGVDLLARDCTTFGCAGGALACTAECEADLAACTGC